MKLITRSIELKKEKRGERREKTGRGKEEKRGKGALCPKSSPSCLVFHAPNDDDGFFRTKGRKKKEKIRSFVSGSMIVLFQHLGNEQNRVTAKKSQVNESKGEEMSNLYS